MSTCRIVGPVFFSETVNSYCYFWLILASFLSTLTEEENVHIYFIEDYTLIDTADFSAAVLEDEVYETDYNLWIVASQISRFESRRLLFVEDIKR